MTATFKKILSSRNISLFIILFAIGGRIFQQIHFIETNADLAYQIQATKNFVKGNGLTILQASPEDISQSAYVPLVKWPPGYSLLLAPFYALCGNSLFWGVICLDILTCICFIYFCRKLIQLFDLPVAYVNFYTLLTGFFIYDFCVSSTSDFITATFYLISFYLSLRVLASPVNKMGTALGIGFFLFYCVLLRYMFIPVTFIIPLYLILYGYASKNRSLLRYGLLIAAVVIVFIAGFFLLQKTFTGTAIYIMSSEKGFYPRYLGSMSPFMFSSITNVPFLQIQLEKITGISFLAIIKIIRLIHWLPVLISSFLFIFFLLRRKLKSLVLIDHYIYLGFFSCITIAGLLLYLSLRNAPVYVNKNLLWTFCGEPRYFAFLIIFFQQLLFVLFYYYQQNFSRTIKRILQFCILIAGLTLLHDIYYTVKMVTADSVYLKKNNLLILDLTRRLLEKTITENPGKKVISLSIDRSFNNYAALWDDIPGLYKYDQLNTLNFPTTQETIIFIALRDREKKNFQQFINSPQTHFLGSLDEYSFYRLNIKPIYRQ